MANKHLLEKLLVPLLFIFVGAFARLLPHAPNFTPIAAIALFGGMYMDKGKAVLFTLLAMLISDVFIGFYSLPMMISVYGSFLIAIFIGVYLKKHKSTGNIILASLFSSIIFFLITNFAVWVFGGLYPKNIHGLISSYYFAIPFFRNTLGGDLFYSGIFFGGYEIVNTFVHGVLVRKA